MNLTVVVFSYFFIGLFGVSLGYHRYLAHKSFQSRKWFEYFIVFCGLPSGTPVQWAGNHRIHHQYADTPKDPHSPYHGGFWYAHCGWYIGQKNILPCLLYALAGPLRSVFDSFWRPRTNQNYNHLAKDIQSDPFYSWLSKPLPYFLMMSLHTGILLGISVYSLGLVKGLIAAYVMALVIYNLGDMVDSLGHMWGKKLEGQNHHARNSLLIGLLTFGDGFHATHHNRPSLARHGQNPGEFDLSFYVLLFLNRLKIVKAINPGPIRQ